jgi:hypothetical protein
LSVPTARRRGVRGDADVEAAGTIRCRRLRPRHQERYAVQVFPILG